MESEKWFKYLTHLFRTYFQMIGTFLPLVFFPDETFVHNLLVPTLLGQYIIKNIVLLSGGVVIGATVKIRNTDAESYI